MENTICKIFNINKAETAARRSAGNDLPAPMMAGHKNNG